MYAQHQVHASVSGALRGCDALRFVLERPNSTSAHGRRVLRLVTKASPQEVTEAPLQATGGLSASAQLVFERFLSESEHTFKVRSAPVPAPPLTGNSSWLTQEIKAANDLQSLERLISQNKTRLNAVHITATFVQISCITQADPTPPPQEQQLLVQLLSELEEAASLLLVTANTSTIPARSKTMHPTVIHPPDSEITTPLLPHDVVNTIGNFTKLHYELKPSTTMHAVQYLRNTPQDPGARDVSMLLWAFAKSEITPAPELLDVICSRCMEVVHTVTPKHQSIMLWSLATLGHMPSPAWMHTWFEACTTSLARATPRDVSEMLWSIAKLRYRPAVALLPAWTSAIRSKIQHYSPRDLSISMWSFARIRYHPGMPWISDVLSSHVNSRPIIVAYKPVDYCNVLWSLASIQAEQTPACVQFTCRALSKLHEFTSHDAAVLLWSVTSLRYASTEAGMHDVLAHVQAHARKRVHTLTPQAAAMLLYSCAVTQRRPDPEVFATLTSPRVWSWPSNPSPPQPPITQSTATATSMRGTTAATADAQTSHASPLQPLSQLSSSFATTPTHTSETQHPHSLNITSASSTLLPSAAGLSLSSPSPPSSLSDASPPSSPSTFSLLDFLQNPSALPTPLLTQHLTKSATQYLAPHTSPPKTQVSPQPQPHNRKPPTPATPVISHAAALALWSCARLRSWPPPFSASFMINAVAANAHLSQPQTLTLCLWAAAKMLYRPDEQIMHSLVWETSRAVHSFSVLDLCNVLWALACLRYAPHALCMEALLGGMVGKMGSLRAMNFASVVWSLHRLEVRPGREFWDEFCTCTGGAVLEQSTLGTIDKTCALMRESGYQPSERWRMQCLSVVKKLADNERKAQEQPAKQTARRRSWKLKHLSKEQGSPPTVHVNVQPELV